MKLILNNKNSAYYGSLYDDKRGANRELSSKKTVKNNYNNSINFTSGIGKITCDTSKIVQKIDEVLGNDYFKKALDGSNFIDKQKNTIVIPDEHFGFELVHSACKMFSHLGGAFLDIINNVLDKFNITTNKDGILANRKKAVHTEKCQDAVREILAKFSGGKDITDGNVDDLAKNFKKTAALNVTEICPSYRSADERALNRIGTSLVSAIYSGFDFYNISILQKDDEKEAKKAGNKRFRVDFARCFLNAAITFVLMSLFEKRINKSIVASTGVLVASSLISEIATRKKSNVPLHRLSPDEAKEYAQKRNNTPDVKDNSSKKLSFKGAKEQEIFKSFTSKDGNIKALDSLNKAKQDIQENSAVADNSKENKKQTSLFKKIAAIVAAASGIYLLSQALNGTLPAKIKRLNLYKANSNLGDVQGEIIKTFEQNAKTKSKFNIFGKINDLLTKKKKEIDLDDMKTKFENYAHQSGEEHGKALFEQYSALIQEQIDKNGGNSKLTIKQDIPIISSVVEGMSKLFKNVYQILSIPARAIELIFDSTLFKKSEKACSGYKPKSYKDQIKTLDKLINKAKGDDNKAMNSILQNIRNFKDKPETGELASLSRTIITLISSYFMINDYANEVLIKSEGKDIQGANEEYVDRLMQKLSNFFFNGTLMNLANTSLKVPLNKSLLAATIIPMGTEWANQILVRKSICQPTHKMHSKQEIMKYEQQQLEQKGFMGWWTKTYRKLTGKKTLSEKAQIKK